MKPPTPLPAVVLCNPKYPHNVAGILRACSSFGIPTLRWTGHRINIDTELGERLPREERMKGYRDVEWRRNDRPFDEFGHREYHVVGIELVPNAESLTHFEHYCIDGHAYNPGNVVYVFGPEDGSIPQAVRCLCHRFVAIPSYHCLNLSAAVNCVLADRVMKLERAGVIEPMVLRETRGMIDVAGWEGK